MKTTDEFVFFWGKYDIYSNFYDVYFNHQGFEFKSSEQAIMYRKAMLFGALDIAEKIIKATSPAQCKSLGRSKLIPFEQDVWVENRERIYKEILMDKFSLSHLKKRILSTGDKVLVEASPYDEIWGIKMGVDHPDVEDPSKWRGLNLLGKVLMEVREELK